ncbi:DUF6807 family protein [Curtobacterium sp. 22159]|uniref:DUF6807 family protein n=1 Tax=Curtobacterium sp. 22159 TaxID=3453882 RepID=UPI003F876880
MTATATVVLVGVRGFGAVHLSDLRRLRASGVVRILGLVDPLVEPGSVDDAPLFPTLAQAFAAVGIPDVVIAAVPIPVHATVTAEALRAGADVLLEKPPFARMTDFEAVLDLERRTGRVVQVGFQSLGSRALTDLDTDRFHLGTVRHVRAMGTWVRRAAYWKRSPWAGRRSLDGVDVVDGVVTNPLAHAVATALRVAHLQQAEDVEHVDVDAYRANPIDADDTTALRIVPAGPDGARPTVSAALTLAAAGEADVPPVVEVVGEHGTITFHYTDDEVVDPSGVSSVSGRTNLLENLIAHRTRDEPLLVPLRSTGAFMRVVEAMRTAPEPARIEGRFVDVVGSGDDAHPVVRDVARWVRAAADVDGTFVDAGAPWAAAVRDDAVAVAAPGPAGPLVTLQDGAGTSATSSPRPFLHPVRTVGGVQLTARRPADHDWHLGLGFTVADVGGTNFWGGGTYVQGRGYVDADDHGHQRLDRVQTSSESGADVITAELTWIGSDGAELLREVRTVTARPIDDATWRLDLRTVLRTVGGDVVPLGSPGSNGRHRAGYGGWFWRFPETSDVEVRTAHAQGEDAVLGTTSPWLLWSADFRGAPGATGPATILLRSGDDRTARDPWFVRMTEYPGVGSAVAWEEHVPVEPGVPFVRSLRAIVADGRRSAEALRRHLFDD